MFAGVLSLDRRRTAAELVGDADLLDTLSPDFPPDISNTWDDGPFLLSQAQVCGSEALATQRRLLTLPARCPKTGRLVAWWGRLDNAHELARDLHLPTGPHSDEQLVLAAFDRWGTACAERLRGDFAGAIYEPVTRRLWLVRDRVGVKPVYYRLTAEAVIFATTAAVFARLRRPGENADRVWIARLLAGVLEDDCSTGWSDVVKLAPGHWLEVDGGSSRRQRYHFWRDDPPWTTTRDQRCVEEYRAVLEEAIRCRLRDTGLIGSESSGGLDSSTVTAYLAEFLGDERERVCTFGWARTFLDGGYMVETNRRAQITHNYVVMKGPPFTDAIRSRWLQALGYPEDAGTPLADRAFFEECRRRGIRTLFAGLGGDETVSNSGSLLGRELLDHRAYRALTATMRGSRVTRPLRTTRAVALRARWGAGNPRLQAAMGARWPLILVRDELAADLGLLDRYQAQAALDAPYRRINDFILHNRLPVLTRRLETSALFAATYGVEYRFPLLDSRLIQQFLSTPAIEKACRDFGRYLHRRAVDGVVSPRVAWKQSKDMGPVIPPSARPRDSAQPFWSIAGPMLEARRQRAALHPIVEEVIDVARLDGQIAAAEDGRLDEQAAFQFHRNVGHLGNLNHWLSGIPSPPLAGQAG
jgi:asparagine synthase (glutamine-hydrolysing)